MRTEQVTITHWRVGHLTATTGRFEWNACGTLEQVFDMLTQRRFDTASAIHVDGRGNVLDAERIEELRRAHLLDFSAVVHRAPWLRSEGSHRAIAAMDRLLAEG